jgi:hypothetical protein
MKEQIDTPTLTPTQTNSAVGELEQIKELARAICGLNTSDGCFCDGGYCNYNCLSYEKAEGLYNAGYRKQSEWISVKDRLPEVDKNVLVITAHGSFKIARCNIYKNGTQVVWATNDGLGERAITHWMPLPEPPEMKGGAE